MDRRTEGHVDVLLDATRNHTKPLTAERLCGWQAALFPTGYSGLRPNEVGRWRTSVEPMQVVSGRVGRERVHVETPPASRVDGEMRLLLDWWNASPRSGDDLLNAGLAHVWFVTIHPFDDGNGRVARAPGDMALARDEGTGMRLYSLSRQIAHERDATTTTRSSVRSAATVTSPEWMLWFVGCLDRALLAALGDVSAVLGKARFRARHASTPLNERQRKVVNRLLDSARARRPANDPRCFYGSLG